MKPTVTVIDYGVGNLLSVSRAFEYCGANVILAETVDQIVTADKLVLPGVGAFADGMAGLKERGFIQPILNHVSSDKPLLGICLGMQMLLDYSEEFGRHQGLGIIPGKVSAIPCKGADDLPHKIPHIGWERLIKPTDHTKWHDTLLDGVEEMSTAYFVHSYSAAPIYNNHRLADVDYNGISISAVIRSGKVYGTQFHPEKSRQQGLHMLNNFLHQT